MTMLNMKRAADIANACAKFVDNTLMKGDVSGAIQQILETFADVVVSLEYYLDNYIQVGVKDDSVLNVAADSVRALGIAVE
jgi:hypothetical protein